MRYPQYPEHVSKLEEELLETWRRERLFEQSLAATAGGEEFVFYEGPPTANGRPGIHHVLSRTIKDLVARYWTMKGRHVTRIAGWDTHGLPVEIEAEKRWASAASARSSSWASRASTRCAARACSPTRKTGSASRSGSATGSTTRIRTSPSRRDYIESGVVDPQAVWPTRVCIYRGYKSVPYCPRCGTAL